MKIGAAIREARSKFTPVRREPHGEMWSYETYSFGAREAASLVYWQVTRIKNREVVYVALILLGWEPWQSRAFADVNNGRGTYYEQIQRAREWRGDKQEENRAA